MKNPVHGILMSERKSGRRSCFRYTEPHIISIHKHISERGRYRSLSRFVYYVPNRAYCYYSFLFALNLAYHLNEPVKRDMCGALMMCVSLSFLVYGRVRALLR